MTSPAKNNNAQDTHMRDIEDWRKRPVSVSREAEDKVILPTNMPLFSLYEALQAAEPKAVSTYELVRKDLMKPVVVKESFADYFPYDAAVASYRAFKQVFGWASLSGIPTATGEEPPTLTPVVLNASGETELVPLNTRYTVPDLPAGYLFAEIEDDVFTCGGAVRSCDRHLVEQALTLTKKILKTESIYQGKAIELHYDDDEEEFQPPSFIDTRETKPSELVLNDQTESLLHATLLTPILKRNQARELKIPLKRGIMLEGPYGCGKTLIAAICAKICEKSGWTFISVDCLEALQRAIDRAKQYQPAVVFAEDLDRFASDRTDKSNDLLNTIDGVVDKNCDVMLVVTSNSVEAITPAMLRPGRIDTVISVSPPDQACVRRLIKQYARGLLDEAANLNEVSNHLSGQIAATIREVVERSKLSMLLHERSTVDDNDLMLAALSMKRHLELLNQKPKQQVTMEDLLTQTIRKASVEPEVTQLYKNNKKRFNKQEYDISELMHRVDAIMQAVGVGK